MRYPFLPRWRIGWTLLVAFAMTLPVTARPAGSDDALSGGQRWMLYAYAVSTWQSFVTMTDPQTGLPADHIDRYGARAGYTSPTNVAFYLWSTLVARDLRLISDAQARHRLGQTLDSLARLERHADSGQFYNWYDPATGAKLTVWPPSGDPVYPFLSSVDNAWLAAALLMVSNAAPDLRGSAQALLAGMDFGCYYDPNARGSEVGAGLMRGGFWPAGGAPPWEQNSPTGNYCGKGPAVTYTGHHYGTLNSETRIISYVAIALDQAPPAHYFAMWRAFPGTCDWSWHEMASEGTTYNYLGIDVYEGHYTYQNRRLVPSWGGSLFEALAPALLVPEQAWGPRNWGINHPLHVDAQRTHGLVEAGYGYWGFAPANDPYGDYRAWGVDPLGMDPTGYPSDEENTTVDYGFRDPAGAGYCPDREPLPPPTHYGRGVVAPYASFLALAVAPAAALENLRRLRQDFDAYDWGGFYDAVGVTTGTVSPYYLALDQGMILAAIGNALLQQRVQAYFTQGAVEAKIKPLLELEEFTAGP